MASVKETNTLHASTTLTGGDTDTVSALVALTSGYGASLYIKLTNDATNGAATGAIVQPEVSPDQTNWFDLGSSMIAPTGTGVVTSQHIEIPISIKNVRITSTPDSTYDTTLDAYVDQITGV